MDKGVFHIITNTDMKHDFSINLQQYNSNKLVAEPVHSEFVMGRDGDDDGDAEVDRSPEHHMATEPSLDGDSIAYGDSDSGPHEYVPSERDIEASTTLIPRLGSKDLKPRGEQFEDVPDDNPKYVRVEDEREPER